MKQESKAKHIMKLKQEIMNYSKYADKLKNEFKIKINSKNIEMYEKDFELDKLRGQVKFQQMQITEQENEIKRLSTSLKVLFDEDASINVSTEE